MFERPHRPTTQFIEEALPAVMPESWKSLFARAAAFDVDEAAIRDALEERRDD